MRKDRERDLEDELALHLELQAEKYRRAGMPAEEAARRARLDFGGATQMKEQCREARGAAWLGDCVRDLAYGARELRRRRAFAAAAVLTIALGIGASTAMFSVVNAVLLRPLPFRDSNRLVLVDGVFSNARFFDLRERSGDVFEQMGSVMVFRAVVSRADGTAERISKAEVDVGFLRMLGARIVLGRDFRESDGQPPARPEPPFPPPQGKVAILSHAYFERAYGGDPSAIGGVVGTGGPRIAGVLAPGFELLMPGNAEGAPDVWIPNTRGYDAAHRDALMLRLVGRLRRGVSLEKAQERIRVTPLLAALVAQVRPAILALMGAVIFLMLIACANVANLLLVRAADREREMVLRAALGAGRGRLFRQMLAEALLLTGLGTLLGTAFAWLGVRGLPAIVPAGVPRLDAFAIDWRVLAFAALAGLAEAFLFGAVPAARQDLAAALRGGGGSAARGRVRKAVVVAEVALSFVLLAGAALMFRSFLELRRVDPGFDRRGLLTFLAIGNPPPGARLAVLQNVRDRLREVPSVESVGGALSMPLVPLSFSSAVAWGDGGQADLWYVLPGYFETLRVPLREGRTFRDADNAPERNVAVIDEQLARNAFPGRSAVGRRLVIHLQNDLPVEVIGVVGHQRLGSLAETGRDQIWLTDGFFGVGISRHWAVRTVGDPAGYAAAVRAAVAKAAPGRLAVTRMETMDAVVRRRSAEIGVRIALGAAPGAIRRMVVGQAMLLSGAGLVLGASAALGLTRLIRGMLVGVEAADPVTFAGVSALFGGIAWLAAWAPARRAARLDPAAVLRE